MPNAIVAPQPVAVEAGANMFMEGGNAVDAALTCALVQAVVDPHMCGVGGYVTLNIHLADGTRHILEAPALAGAKVREDMWVEKLIRPNPDGWGYFLEGKVNTKGYTSVCTPGTVKAFATMLDRWGTRAWGDICEPAVRVATDGYVVMETQANRWKTPGPYPESVEMRELLDVTPDAQRIYLKEGGATYEMGESLRNLDYAKTLAHLTERGMEDFYHGELADRMAADLAANGSYVTRQDFADYALRDEEPVTGTYRGYTVTSAGPPHGGPTLLAILNILEGYDLAAMGHNSPDYIYTVSMAMKAAFADRNPYMADPHFVDVPLEMMLSKERAAEWRQRIDSGDDINVSFVASEAPHTTHVSVVDDAGNCVALTHSLGASSGVITPGLGFMYNNSMINFHPLPGHPNSIAPKKGRSTGMAPTMVYKDDKPFIVLGSPGATRIITSNLQVILNVLDFGMSIDAAVHAPRFDCQLNNIRCHMRIPDFVINQVAKRHPVVRIPRSHGGFALVHAITIDPETGALAGAADTGADGMALVV
jgi:gamma-glutamyltranspeptidase/glutathione hydrolase